MSDTPETLADAARRALSLLEDLCAGACTLAAPARELVCQQLRAALDAHELEGGRKLRAALRDPAHGDPLAAEVCRLQDALRQVTEDLALWVDDHPQPCDCETCAGSLLVARDALAASPGIEAALPPDQAALRTGLAVSVACLETEVARLRCGLESLLEAVGWAARRLAELEPGSPVQGAVAKLAADARVLLGAGEGEPTP